MMDLLSDYGFWLVLFWAFVPGVLCYLMAMKKRRSTLFWILAGLTFGWIAVLILYFLPKLPPKEYNIEKKDKIYAKLKMYETLNEMREAKEKKENQNIGSV
jgi:hypothetical protein